MRGTRQDFMRLRVCVHACVQARMHRRTCVCVSACMCPNCVPEGARTCAYLCVHARLHTWACMWNTWSIQGESNWYRQEGIRHRDCPKRHSHSVPQGISAAHVVQVAPIKASVLSNKASLQDVLDARACCAREK